MLDFKNLRVGQTLLGKHDEVEYIITAMSDRSFIYTNKDNRSSDEYLCQSHSLNSFFRKDPEKLRKYIPVVRNKNGSKAMFMHVLFSSKEAALEFTPADYDYQVVGAACVEWSEEE